jgi:hypothetical protein
MITNSTSHAKTTTNTNNTNNYQFGTNAGLAQQPHSATTDLSQITGNLAATISAVSASELIASTAHIYSNYVLANVSNQLNFNTNSGEPSLTSVKLAKIPKSVSTHSVKTAAHYQLPTSATVILSSSSNGNSNSSNTTLNSSSKREFIYFLIFFYKTPVGLSVSSTIAVVFKSIFI